jgi:hypothetical protein
MSIAASWAGVVGRTVCTARLIISETRVGLPPLLDTARSTPRWETTPTT